MLERNQLISMVWGLQAGDPNAATTLYETFQGDIYYFILKTVNNDRELAEDLTQDTFVEILETINNLQEPAAFVTWSKQIAYHKCTGYFRKRKELLADENEDGYSVFDTMEEDREEFIPDAALDHQDLRQTILKMINDLPEEQKSAILLRYFNEISVKEIAQIQGVTEGTVKSRLNYGRKSIKQAVEAFEKKNDVKLHSIAILPLLLWFFKKYRIDNNLQITSNTTIQAFVIGGESAGTAMAGASASASASAVSASTTATIATGAKTAVAVGGKALATKIIAGIVAAVVVATGSITVSVLQNTKNKNVLVSGNEFVEILPEHVEHIAFTDIEAPLDVELIDLSHNRNDGIIAWFDDASMYVTSSDGGKIYANENCYGMFSRLTNLKSIDLSNFDTSNVVDMSAMFALCENLQDITFGEFNTSSVESMWCMFESCSSLTSLDLSDWDVSNVTNMYGMFLDCSNLEKLDLSRWDIKNVETLSYMFAHCNNLRSMNLSGWDTSSVTDMSWMFFCCEKIKKLDLSSFDVSNIQVYGIDKENDSDEIYSGFDGMFWNCHELEMIFATNWTEENGLDASFVDQMFVNNFNLVGAIPYTYEMTGFEMANSVSGYFSEKEKIIDNYSEWSDSETTHEDTLHEEGSLGLEYALDQSGEFFG